MPVKTSNLNLLRGVAYLFCKKVNSGGVLTLPWVPSLLLLSSFTVSAYGLVELEELISCRGLRDEMLKCPHPSPPLKTEKQFSAEDYGNSLYLF